MLAFDGLDTVADVRLDGHTILHSDNMFLPHRADVTELMKRDSVYTLDICFEPALAHGKEVKAQHPDHKYICFNGDSARLAVRKAQYSFGWDVCKSRRLCRVFANSDSGVRS